jgi:hypothetical protein
VAAVEVEPLPEVADGDAATGVGSADLEEEPADGEWPAGAEERLLEDPDPLRVGAVEPAQDCRGAHNA